MPAALLRTITPPRAGEVPLAVLVDYDGTISIRDVGDALMERHVSDAVLVAAMDVAFDRGEIPSRDLLRWNVEVLPADEALLRRSAAQVEQDPAFPGFVGFVRSIGGLVEVVSDGLGFYIESNLVAQDPALADLPVATNANRIDGPGSMSFPYANPLCDACGTCKRERVRLHRAAGRVVIMVGDGTTDRYAAHEADVTFAKGKLLAWATATCREAVPWHDFGDVRDWIAGALADGRLPGALTGLAAWRTGSPVPGQPPICGPEVWGGAALRG